MLYRVRDLITNPIRFAIETALALAVLTYCRSYDGELYNIWFRMGMEETVYSPDNHNVGEDD